MIRKSIKSVVLAVLFGILMPQLSHGEKLYNAQTFTLTNGLVVYLIENHRTPVVSHMVVYRVGSADDPKGKSGLAHFLEHMMFKGPKGSAPERVMEDVNKIGGEVNATTSFDVTSYYEIIPRDNLEHFMKLEASRMQDLPVRLEDVTPEIQVVLEEENMRVGNNPMMQFYRDLYSAYFRHHPYGTMPIGWRHEIKTYTPKDVKAFHRRYYAPDNAFIILSGDLTLSKAKELCEKYYGGIAPAKQARRQRVKEPALESMVEITKTSARVAQSSVVLMMPAPTYDPENPIPAGALDLGIYGLSNSATGLLYRRLVEELKIATSFSLDYDPYQLDNTTITIVARSSLGISPEALKQAIQEEIKNFIEKGFTAEQL
ncbi:MAG TPA: peptidase M16, partial [Holosporales bacterium]|nr:peptidase M16 [Holosporales bacterium]